jgi:hypothetical protein
VSSARDVIDEFSDLTSVHRVTEAGREPIARKRLENRGLAGERETALGCGHKRVAQVSRRI